MIANIGDKFWRVTLPCGFEAIIDASEFHGSFLGLERWLESVAKKHRRKLEKLKEASTRCDLHRQRFPPKGTVCS